MLTSATLQIGGSFRYARERIGLDDTTFTLAVRAWRLSHVSAASDAEDFSAERASVHTIKRDPVLAA